MENKRKKKKMKKKDYNSLNLITPSGTYCDERIKL